MSGHILENNSSSSVTVAPTPSATLMASVSTKISSAIDPKFLSHVGDGIFLQTKTAQGLAGICVWVALFLSCQQVILISFFSLLLWNFEHFDTYTIVCMFVWHMEKLRLLLCSCFSGASFKLRIKFNNSRFLEAIHLDRSDLK